MLSVTDTKGTAPAAPFLYHVGENDTKIDTKSTPYEITSSGHHRSNQNDSLDELISTFSFPQS
jgi:hypothetical protein